MALSVTSKKKSVAGELVMVVGRAILTYTTSGAIPTGLRTVLSFTATPFRDSQALTGGTVSIISISGGNVTVQGVTGSSMTFTALGYGL